MKVVVYLLNKPPIRKVVAAALATAVVFLARRLHVEVESQAVTDAISGAIPLIVAYATPDPRVK